MGDRKLEILPGVPCQTMSRSEQLQMERNGQEMMNKIRQNEENEYRRRTKPFTIFVGVCHCGGKIKCSRSSQFDSNRLLGPRTPASTQLWVCYCLECGIAYSHNADRFAGVIKKHIASL